jgi:hypothetical protein
LCVCIRPCGRGAVTHQIVPLCESRRCVNVPRVLARNAPGFFGVPVWVGLLCLCACAWVSVAIHVCAELCACMCVCQLW